jgi:hypothetical protein
MSHPGGTSGPPTRRILAVFCFAGALVVNALANRLPLGGNTTGELSALYPNLVVPVGFTFSIWGVIYLLLLGWSVEQFREKGSDAGRAVATGFALSSVLNAAWLLVWHYRFPGISVLVMLGLLGVLLRINHELAMGRNRVPGLARAAFGIYLGWIVVATVVNVTAWLVSLGWAGGPVPAVAWAVILVLAGAGLSLLALFRFRNPFVGVAVAWAFAGIAVNRWVDVPTVAWTAVAMAVVVGSAALALVLGGRPGQNERRMSSETLRPGIG